jgi:hypothetical protein
MSAPRTPPAFIPTLSPLQEGEAAAVKSAPLLIDLPLLEEEVLPPEAQLARAPLPFRAMPNIDLNLGEPHHQAPHAVPFHASQPIPPENPERQGIDDSASQAEQMRTRLLQRVDVIVQRRVREAAAAIALDHAQNLLQELRPALEKAITESVNEALALEVAVRQRAKL